MDSRTNIKVLYNQLYQAFKELEQIYYKLPMSNKSCARIQSLDSIITVHLFPICKDLPAHNSDETIITRWFNDELRARYVLFHIKIQYLDKLRLAKSFTPTEKLAIPNYISIIKNSWVQLCELLPLTELQDMLSKSVDDINEQFCSYIPVDWK